MVAFELSRGPALPPLDGDDVPANATGTKKTKRWLKVGAAAIGGGALVALTGGLAAPAIAAGLGSAVTVFGGSAATAGTVTTFAASSAGTATITGTLGAVGAGSTGRSMAKRTGDIKEFGFWDLSEVWDREATSSNAEDAEISEEARKGSPGFLSALKGRTSSSEEGAGCGKGIGEHNDGAAHAQVKKNPKPSKWGWKWRRSTTTADHGEPSSSTQSGHDIAIDTETESSNAPQDSHGTQFGSKHLSGSSQLFETAEPDQGRPSSTDNNGEGTEKAISELAVAVIEQEAGNEQAKMASWWRRWTTLKEKKPLLPGPINPHRPDGNMAVTIAVTGWLTDHKDFVEPWNKLPGLGTDKFALVWESKVLKEVGDALFTMLKAQVAGEAGKFFVKQFLHTGLIAALTWPALVLTASSVIIDNRWAIAMDRARQAGKLLAASLVEQLRGSRPVTLVAFSLGSRLVLEALLELSEKGHRGIVEHAVLLGTPAGLGAGQWAAARGVVAGRLINGYSQKDWILGLVYRASTGQLQKAAGLMPVEVAGVENVDLTSVVGGHTDYISKMSEVLKCVNFPQS
ncbi:unnamed protein product [Ostreobium quekettii]|uniref:DUF726-domain-containing protein n=1 Tax=Ostreobium quekettii TaxID=121088 RepID=A0A8S1J7Z5_9CHLO|nr:unnamed protein product [Ostreobium quekettii]|eukprot:evm.model.scf_238EXC.10 EVM.evm.TU.scf_238EXC.10   scf_238EXC:94801-98370(-)